MKREWMKLLTILALAGIMVGCEKDEDSDLKPPDTVDTAREIPAHREHDRTTHTPPRRWVTYTLPQGQHHNDLRGFEFFHSDSLAFYFSFDSTAVYQTADPANQMDWNKLMGFSDCGTPHHQNSIRLVWRYANGQVEIGEYRYTSGERLYSTIGTTSIGDTNFASIAALPGKYKVRFNKIEEERPRTCQNRTSSYWLYPYFGGDETAPHDINVHVLHLD